MPATKAKVVIKIGLNRSRLASKIASNLGLPCAIKWLVWSTCRMAFFFTTPKSTMMPSADMTESSWSNKSSDMNANGIVSGNASMIVIG